VDALIESLEQALNQISTDMATDMARQLVASARMLTPTSGEVVRESACRGLIAASSQLYRVGAHDDGAAAMRMAVSLCSGLQPKLVATARLRDLEMALLRQDIGYALNGLGDLLVFLQTHGLKEEESLAWRCHGMALQAAGLHEQADRLLARSLTLVDAERNPHEAGHTWVVRVQLKRHDSAESLAAAREACEQARLHGQRSEARYASAIIATALCNRAGLELMHGFTDAARAALAEAEALTLPVRTRWLVQVVRALIDIAECNDAATRQRLEDMLHAPGGPPSVFLVETYSVAAVVFAQLGDNANAVRMLSKLSDTRQEGFRSLLASGMDVSTAAWNDILPGVAEGRGTVLERVAVIAELRDDTTGRHCFRVGRLAALLAERAGLPAAAVAAMNVAARLHDLGKVAIPDPILLKPGRLDEHELGLMRRHTVLGHDLLGDGADEVHQLARLIARHHHERWDGAGYPDGLAGEAIPVVARVATLADVFDALTHARPYKRAWARGEAVDYIRQNAGIQFDPALTHTFLALLAEAEADWPRFHADLEAEASRSGLVRELERELETV
jgi:HD-GYP domain-containing protein (c-di-GMP phosphodiesterase class II)